MIKYSVYLNGKAVTPDEVRERLDANEGKCQFMLLPSGELRLRVYNDDHYSFFPLPSVYEVRLYAVEDPLTTDLRQRVETLTKALEAAKDFIGRLPVKYDVIPGVGYAMKSNMYPVLRVLGYIDLALKSGDVEKSSLKETPNSELANLRAQVEEKNKALAKAAQWFSEYAEMHDAKGDTAKAIRNWERAVSCRIAISATGKEV